jgi:hypothetical protein
MTLVQPAMITALMYPEPDRKGGRGKKGKASVSCGERWS